MSFTWYVPAPPLNKYIMFLWSQIGYTPYVREKVLPMGMVDLMFNLGAPHKVLDKTDVNIFDLYRRGWVSGLHTEYIVIEAVAETDIMGARFHPGGAHALFDCPIVEFSNYVIDLPLIWGRFVEEVCEQLWLAKSMAQRFTTLERLLLQRFQPDLKTLLPIQVAANRIYRGDFETIRVLSDEIGISQKHLISRCKQLVGASPKSLHRIGRFNSALRTLNDNKTIDLAELALRCGYYDQAHFNRDFRAFSGLSPKHYLQKRAHWFPDLGEEDGGIHFVPDG